VSCRIRQKCRIVPDFRRAEEAPNEGGKVDLDAVRAQPVVVGDQARPPLVLQTKPAQCDQIGRNFEIWRNINNSNLNSDHFYICNIKISTMF
jgi:hypothetical protein